MNLEDMKKSTPPGTPLESGDRIEVLSDNAIIQLFISNLAKVFSPPTWLGYSKTTAAFTYTKIENDIDA